MSTIDTEETTTLQLVLAWGFVGIPLAWGVIQTLISFDGSLSSWWTRIVIGALLFVSCLLQRMFEARRG